jgi:uncharacterized protein (TIGR02246 family)
MRDPFRRSLFLVLLTLGCAPAARDTTADEAAIRAQTDRLVQAMATAAPDSAMGLFTERGALYPPNTPAVVGRAAIREWSVQMFAALKVTGGQISFGEIKVAGDWAVSHGTWAFQATAGSQSIVDTTHFMTIWERQPDGAWLISHDLWNSVRPLPPAGS